MPRYCIRSDNFQAISYFLDYPYTLGPLRSPPLPLFRLSSLCSVVDLLSPVHGQRIFPYFPYASTLGDCLAVFHAERRLSKEKRVKNTVDFSRRISSAPSNIVRRWLKGLYTTKIPANPDETTLSLGNLLGPKPRQ